MTESILRQNIQTAAAWLSRSRHAIAFTGAGISVESGIPPFRGENGLWNRYNPQCVDLGYFTRYPDQAWPVLKEIFYDFMGRAVPNNAHVGLSRLEKAGVIQWIITQNIDALHHLAGSTHVTEYHGTIETLHCLNCLQSLKSAHLRWTPFPPVCADCGGPLKPDFVFFGEMIPPDAMETALAQAQAADVIVVIGANGEVMPAAMLPNVVKHNGGKVIEINVAPSNYTENVSDCFLQGKAAEIMEMLTEATFDLLETPE